MTSWVTTSDAVYDSRTGKLHKPRCFLTRHDSRITRARFEKVRSGTVFEAGSVHDLCCGRCGAWNLVRRSDD